MASCTCGRLRVPCPPFGHPPRWQPVDRDIPAELGSGQFPTYEAYTTWQNRRREPQVWSYGADGEYYG